MESHMSPRLYKAAAAGDVHYLSSNEISEELNLSSDTESKERKERLRCHLLCLTHEKNNCLHIAARFGYKTFVGRVLTLCPSLVYHQNKRGDNPLHVAARAGHLRIVELLTDSFKKLQSPQSTENNRAITGEGNNENNTEPPRTSQSQSSTGNSATTGDDITSGRSLREAEEGERPSCPKWGTQNQQLMNSMTSLTDSIDQTHPPSSQIESSSSTGEIVNGITSSEMPSLPIWRTENNYGNTALHEALLSKHKKVAFHLLDLNSELVVLVVNTKGESPLYLAAEAGFVTVVDKILGAGGKNNVVGPMGQTALHAAVFSRSKGCIKSLHNSIPELIRKQDSYGKTALYYAAQSNYIKIMRQLLKLDASSAYIHDNEGLSPLLAAASMGRSTTVRAILDACPASVESSDDSGHNALHQAVKYNTLITFKQLLKMPEMMSLINEPNHEGITPLHLATLYRRDEMVSALFSTKRVDLTAKNNLGQTALDLCVLDTSPVPSNLQRITTWALKKNGAPRGRVRPLMRLPIWDPNSVSTKAKDTNMTQAANTMSVEAAMATAQDADMIQLANTMSVVAALLFTVTFAAAFTIPGGLKVDGSGSPSLIHKPALIIFCISNTIAMCFSMAALVLLLLATFSLTHSVSSRSTIYQSTLLIFGAACTAMIAFISGFYAVISIESTWLGIVVCIIGSGFPILVRWTQQAGSIVTAILRVPVAETNKMGLASPPTVAEAENDPNTPA
ncbi:protein ACCELERATED CELL DEATH 6-like [Telopea speciosissima]|uniref:protein ACCELERATED CELL DEATH 6-like n=1 Tax=Telopea speciosissima TaxID=54955 RepID=UPI001CC3D815|nr:protein ACCELERATED CELL DEATH 6-like [Telopea speciosissima]